MRDVIVWGNCQAPPLADLLREPLSGHGLRTVPVPPVHLIDEAGLADVRRRLERAALLVSQPVRDEYRLRGCGTAQLAALLPPDGELLTVPIAYHVAAFPNQVNAHTGDGGRIDAPVTDYHDLRVMAAARRGDDPASALASWPAPAADALRANAERSRATLAGRERDLDVRVSDLLDDPGAMWTMSHPANPVLAALAGRVLAALQLRGEVTAPRREYLGERRAPVDAHVARALGWPADPARRLWRVRGRAVSWPRLLAAQLPFYVAHPDVVADAWQRYADRLDTLGLR